MRSETNVAEEYCWAITQAASKSRCVLSGPSVLTLVFHMDCVAYTHIVDHMYTQFSDLHKILLEPDIAFVGKCPS
jgi:hypothetical protein